MDMHFEKTLDWGSACNNRVAVPDHQDYFDGWARDAAAYRENHAFEEVAYGDHPRERFHLFLPDGPPKGLHIYIHGGWWKDFGREYYSHLAAGPLAHGWAMAIPSYTLAPENRISEILDQATAAVSKAAQTVPDVPLTISGHSAGGHLASMMATEAAGPDPAARKRLIRIISLSGIADVRPVIGQPVNDDLRIDEEEARRISPLFHLPRTDIDFYAWVGADESIQFRRQNAILGQVWGSWCKLTIVEEPDTNHFNVMDPLADPNSILTRLAVGQDVEL